MQLARISQDLQKACHARDWQALGRVDRELASALAQWPALSQWSTAERGQLDQLRQIHTQARQQCAGELQQLTDTLGRMRQGRSRWQAYAESAGWRELDEEGLA